MKTTLKIVLTNNNGNNQSSYVAGSTITGYLSINTNKKLSIKNLQLTFTGQEDTVCSWETSNTMVRPHQSRRKYDIAEVAVPIDDLPDLIDGGKVLLPGEFKIPFSFNLPRNLPTNFKEALIPNGVPTPYEPDYCEITYSMDAVLEEMGHCLTGFLKIKSHKHIKITAKPKKATPLHYLLAPVSMKIPQFMCFCKTGGSLTFGAKLVPSQQLKRLQRMELEMAMINDTTLAVQKIDLHLQQKVTWKYDKGLTRSKKRTIASRIVSLPKKKNSSSSPSTTRRRSSLSLMSLSSGNNVKKKEDAVRQALLSGGSSADVFDIYHLSARFSPTSPSVFDSYLGHLIEVKHVLEVIIDTGCGKWNPKFEIPIEIIPGSYYDDNYY